VLVMLLILNKVLLIIPLFPMIIILLSIEYVLCTAVRDQSRILSTTLT